MPRRIFSKTNIIIAVLLFIAWIVFSALTFNKISFSVVTYQVKNIVKHNFSSKDLSGNNVFAGEFQSKDNNLGLIGLSFNHTHLLNANINDVVIFKLKEKGNLVWYSQRRYILSLFDSQSNFVFGFLPIVNSKNKKYQFELSLITNDNKYLEIKKNEYFMTGYQYSRTELTNKRLVLPFLLSKISGSFSDSEFIEKLLVQTITLTFCLSVIGGFSYFFSNKLHIKNVTRKITAIIFLIDSKITFAICFALIILWLLIIPFDLQKLQDQLNVVVYFLLLIGCVQLFFEERRK